MAQAGCRSLAHVRPPPPFASFPWWASTMECSEFMPRSELIGQCLRLRLVASDVPWINQIPKQCSRYCLFLRSLPRVRRLPPVLLALRNMLIALSPSVSSLIPLQPNISSSEISSLAMEGKEAYSSAAKRLHENFCIPIPCHARRQTAHLQECKTCNYGFFKTHSLFR